MDLFKKWLNKENESNWIRRALIDSSYKNEFQREIEKSIKGKLIQT